MGTWPPYLHTFHLDWAQEPMESEFDQAVFASLSPSSARERGKLRGRQAQAVFLVAGDAVPLPAIDFGSFDKERFCFAFERGFGNRNRLGSDGLALQVGQRGLENRLDRRVDWELGRFLEDGEA